MFERILEVVTTMRYNNRRILCYTVLTLLLQARHRNKK